MRLHYTGIARASSLALNWGTTIWISSIILINYTSWDFLDLVKTSAEYILFAGVVLHLLAKNLKIRKGDLVKVWIETNKVKSSHLGKVGKYYYFPAHSVPSKGEKVLLVGDEFPGGQAEVRITGKSFVFVGEKFGVVKLYCLV